MNFKIKFEFVPIGEPFLYNDIIYIKTSETEGNSQRLGSFTIHRSEMVEVITEPQKPSLKFFGPFGVLVYLIACIPFLLLCLYCLVESL